MTPRFWETLVLLGAVGAVFAIAVRLLLPRILAWRGVWFTWHTKFGPALVFDAQDDEGTTVRLLNVGGTFQSVCYVDKELLWDPVCEYHRSWAHVVHTAWPLAKAKDQQVLRRALIMGGGGFSFPKWLVAYRPDFMCATVEIDQAIIGIAYERFFLEELEAQFDTRRSNRLEVCIGDAWEYLTTDARKYDLIVNDAFRGNRPLGGMGTHEGAKVVRRHLLPGGVYIGNVRTPLVGRQGRTLDHTCSAFAKVFENVWIIPERPEEPAKPGNNALVACDKPLCLDNIAGVITYSPTAKEAVPWQTT